MLNSQLMVDGLVWPLWLEEIALPNVVGIAEKAIGKRSPRACTAKLKSAMISGISTGSLAMDALPRAGGT